MRNLQIKLIFVAAVTCLMVGMAVSAQDNGGQSYSTAQLEQFVAPVALYQVLMASTYPGEVVEANEWARQNPNLRGDDLAVALDGQNWDVSVKSLVPFPSVLSRMAENEAWTQDLGDAYLVQPNDVMDSVQSLRHRAYKAGNLETSVQQRVVVEGQYIQIAPVNVETVYVPAYNPMVVYGPGWGYPTYYYPAMMAPPPYYVAGNVISFGVGFVVGAALFGAFDWNHHNVYYGDNFYQYRGYHRNVEVYREVHPDARPGSHTTWQHDPVHRGSGGYHNPVLDKKYGHGASPQGAHSAAPGAPPPPVVRNPAPGTRPQQPNAPKAPPEVRNPRTGDRPQQPNAPKAPPEVRNPRTGDRPQQPNAPKAPPVVRNPRTGDHPRQPKAPQASPETRNPRTGDRPEQPKATNPQSGGNGPNRPGPAVNQGSHPGASPSAPAKPAKPAKPNNAPKGEEKKGEQNK